MTLKEQLQSRLNRKPTIGLLGGDAAWRKFMDVAMQDAGIDMVLMLGSTDNHDVSVELVHALRYKVKTLEHRIKQLESVRDYSKGIPADLETMKDD